jgi:hypothetical protein
LRDFYEKLGFVDAFPCFQAWSKKNHILFQYDVNSWHIPSWEADWYKWASPYRGQEIPQCLYKPARKASEPIVDIDAVEEEKKEEEEEKEKYDRISVAHTTMTKMTKSKSGHVHRHCTTGTCKGKQITGNNWQRHVTTFHAGIELSFIKCVDNCPLCD